MSSIEVIPTHADADLGEAWVRYQSARIRQKHLQLGRHFRLDLNALVHRLAIAHRAQVESSTQAPALSSIAA